MFSLVTTAIAAFVATNIDDLFLLAAWFVRRSSLPAIFLGQLAGFSVLVSISIGAFFLGAEIPQSVIRWLGLVPIAIGLKEILRTDTVDVQTGSSWLSIAFVTVANGADNVGVYIPLFLENKGSVALIVLVFYTGLFIWVVVAKLFECILSQSKTAHHIAHRLSAPVLILIGIKILLT